MVFVGIDFGYDKNSYRASHATLDRKDVAFGYDNPTEEIIDKSFEAQYRQMKYLVENARDSIPKMAFYNASPAGRMDFCERIAL